MAEYSEEELVDSIKNWLKNNGIGVIAGLAIGLAGVFGWRFWNDYQISQAEQASAYYDAFTEAIAEADMPKARGQAVVLLDDFADSDYAVFAALNLAKIAVQDGDNSEAQERLQWALSHTEDTALQDIIRLRLARVLLAEQQLDEMQKQLEQVSSNSFTAEVEELKGDLYLAREQPDKARTAYQAAQAALGDSANGSLLQMKLDDISS